MSSLVSSSQPSDESGKTIASNSKKTRKASALAKQDASEKEAIALTNDQDFEKLRAAEVKQAELRDAQEAISIEIRNIRDARDAQARIKNDENDLNALVQARLTEEIHRHIEVDKAVANQFSAFKRSYDDLMTRTQDAARTESYGKELSVKSDSFDFFAGL